MSIIDRISAVLPVADMATAEPWYERLFGRPADAVPMASLREWHEGSGGVAVLVNGERAGMGYAIFHVDLLEGHRAVLAERGLTLGPRQAGDAAGIAQIADPSGNLITLAQRRPGPEAGPSDNAGIVRRLLEAFRDRRRQDAEALLGDDYTFTSQYDDHIDRAAFFARCWPLGAELAEMKVERITTDTEGAFITYLVTTKNGAQFRNTEYATVSKGKIHSTMVYFGASYRNGAQVAKSPSHD